MSDSDLASGKKNLWLHSTIVWLSFGGITALGMVLNPDSFWKFFTSPLTLPESSTSLSYYWDIQAYGELALDPQCSAFYPLWPMLIRWGFHPSTIVEAARSFLGVATILSFVGVPLLLKLFRQGFQNDRLALEMALLYSLSPLAIFRVIGYTESLFGVLGILLLLLLSPDSSRSSRWIPLWGGGLAALLALLRPTLPQMLGSSVATLITLGIVDQIDRGGLDEAPEEQALPFSWRATYQLFQQRYPLALPLTLTLIIGTIAGYSLYGWFCWQTTGDFFGAFSQQHLWNKSLDFRPWLLFTSRSPIVDLWGLYLPALLWIVAVGQVGQTLGYLSLPPLRGGVAGWLLATYPPLWILIQTWNRPVESRSSPVLPLPPWAKMYGFWFALYFSASHAAIVGLTQDRLVSLGRYIFAQPFVFYALGCLYPHLDRRHQRFLWPTLLGLSSLGLANQWIRYGHHQWLG